MGAFDCDCIENLMGRFEEEQKADRIQNAIRHIKSSVDIDPWAMELAVEALEKEIQNDAEDAVGSCPALVTCIPRDVSALSVVRQLTGRRNRNDESGVYDCYSRLGRVWALRNVEKVGGGKE